jgi:hypothetical protein
MNITKGIESAQAEVTPQPLWRFPFADRIDGKLTPKHWILAVAIMIVVHVAALQASRFTGNFDPNPSKDYRKYMREILDHGYPTPSIYPPGLGYYVAFKSLVTDTLRLPYWSAKYFIDVVPIVIAGVLSILLGHALTRNRILALASGFGLIAAPIFILGVAEEEEAVLFQPFFLASLFLLIRQLQRKDGPTLIGTTAAGGLMGLACLIRGNPQFIILFLALYIIWCLKKLQHHRWFLRGCILIAVFVLGQFLAMLPWSLMQRKAGSGMFFMGGGPSIYLTYFSGIVLHPGNRVSDYVRLHPIKDGFTLHTVIDFNLKWLREDPLALIELYVLKFVRSWYISASGRWDTAILILHAPLWILALVGLVQWRKTAKADPALIFIVVVILYMWLISGIMKGVARYSSPLYGFIGLLAGVVILKMFKQPGAAEA